MRFVVRTVTGYSEDAGTSSQPQTSYSVLDTHYNYREVRRFYAGRGRSADFTRRTLANEACAALNEWHDAAA